MIRGSPNRRRRHGTCGCPQRLFLGLANARSCIALRTRIRESSQYDPMTARENGVRDGHERHARFVPSRHAGKRQSGLPSPVPKSDCKLQHGSDRYPNEIRDLGKGNPTVTAPYGHHHPGNSQPDYQNIDRSERQVAPPKLDRCENQIRDQVQGERKCYLPFDLSPQGHYKNKPKTDHNNGVENLPYQPDCCGLWGPAWLMKGVVPIDPRHGTAQPPRFLPRISSSRIIQPMGT